MFPLWAWLLSLSVLTLRFLNVVVCINSLLVFISGQYFIIWLFHNFFYSSIYCIHIFSVFIMKNTKLGSYKEEFYLAHHSGG
jgi:hypothetical protein